jgi:DMSO/TMAO reductase YedYZ heme-binding membrane subunit
MMIVMYWICGILVGIILFMILSIAIFLSIDEAQRRIDARQD